MQSNDLEGYHFRGNEDEEIPGGIRKLIVGPGVQVLPDHCIERLLFVGLQEVILCEGLILIGDKSFISGKAVFHQCKSLANLALPKDSVVLPPEPPCAETFYEARLLEKCFGRDQVDIVAGLMNRFDEYPIHKLCYHHSAITAQELRQCIDNQDKIESSYADKLGMTPLHILFSTVEPSHDLLHVLLAALPCDILDSKDANRMRPLDYLFTNWSDKTRSLLQTTYQIWLIDPIKGWGPNSSWEKALMSKVEEILAEDGDTEQRVALFERAYRRFKECKAIESTSVLEIALWKMKLKSGWSDGCPKLTTVDRGEYRCVCGSNVLIPNVIKFFDIPRE
ncbi:unnamed protein product [Cylindrotheca closterium]|uniref:Uncharacterized protein n=1 Tax=Cylindrotheca closterium TaxID=2856 RepID=A0AAD2JJY4_9STRA|nr:unnamed protein product [Cylindrotheca closterium]